MRFILSIFVVFAAVPSFANLTIYTDRPTARVQPMADEFTKRTGTAVTIVELGYKDLLGKLQTEGSASPADVVFVKDMVYLTDLANQKLLQPIGSSKVKGTVAPSMRDLSNLWTAITIRARTIVYDPSRVNAAELSTYENLADAKWAGRLCLRTSKSSYNEALVSGLVKNLGFDRANEVVNGWVSNLAQAPFANDTALLEAMANGMCEVGIVNSYYLGALIAQNPNFPVKIFFANQDTTGTHVNGTGAGVAKFSKQPALAEAFIELMLEESWQLYLSSSHFDYPAKAGLQPSTHIKNWGTFRPDASNWSLITPNLESARKIMIGADYQ